MKVRKSHKYLYYAIPLLLLIYTLIKFINTKHVAVKESDNLNTEEIISGSFDQTKVKTREEWRKILTSEQFYILQEGGTEVPFSGALDKEYRPGTYYSHGCDVPLFRSETKYDSGTGWPSFYAPIKPESVVLRVESDGRTEVLDPCGGHLGHVFNDGPPPTGLRYCLNSVALLFVPD